MPSQVGLYLIRPNNCSFLAVDLANAYNVSFEYSVFFPDDFDFALGGKLPGLYGGRTACVRPLRRLSTLRLRRATVRRCRC
jgi:hypothetical protein